MFNTEMVIWSDPEFLKEDGTPENGAEIYGECFRCHPSEVQRVQDGLNKMLGLNIKVVEEKPEFYNAQDN